MSRHSGLNAADEPDHDNRSHNVLTGSTRDLGKIRQRSLVGECKMDTLQTTIRYQRGARELNK